MKQIFALCFALLFVFQAGCARRGATEPEFRIVTSFYPMYIIALNITDGVEGVRVDNMAGQQAGCLHDYQLQSKDMQNIEQADVFVINGAGMESFMEKVAGQLPGLRIVEASEGIPLIQEDEEENPHVWVSISDCIRQVDTVARGLEEADPKRAAAYRENAQRYQAKLIALRGEMHEALDGLPNRDVITFHEAFPYFAREFDLNIVRVVNREPDSQPSARELADTIHIIQESGVHAVFAEPQYSDSAARIVAGESGAEVYFLDPAVTGDDTPDAYLNAMRGNLEVLRRALS